MTKKTQYAQWECLECKKMKQNNLLNFCMLCGFAICIRKCMKLHQSKTHNLHKNL